MKRLTTKMPNGYLFNLPSINDEQAQMKYVDELADKLGQYEDAEEQGLLLRFPCKVGDKAYLIGKDENGHQKVYEGVWDSISMAQRKNGNFEVCGHISYDVYDFFYDDGRTMLHGMYVGQETTKFDKVAFLTREEAEQALVKMQLN